MSFKEYIEESIHEDIDFADNFGSEIGGYNSDFGWVRLDNEIRIEKYNQQTKEAIIIVNWIAESRNTDNEHFGEAKLRVLVEGNGNKPAKFKLLEMISVGDDDGLM